MHCNWAIQPIWNKYPKIKQFYYEERVVSPKLKSFGKRTKCSCIYDNIWGGGGVERGSLDIWYLIFLGGVISDNWFVFCLISDIWFFVCQISDFFRTRDIRYLIFSGVWYMIFDFLGGLISYIWSRSIPPYMNVLYWQFCVNLAHLPLSLPLA